VVTLVAVTLVVMKMVVMVVVVAARYRRFRCNGGGYVYAGDGSSGGCVECILFLFILRLLKL
jgi:hypothetical protein